MKKGLFVLLAIVTVTFAGYHFADARPYGGGGMMGYGGGYGYCDNCLGPLQGKLDEEALKAREKFLLATKGLRKTITMKQAEMTALMNRENPDEKKASKLAGELFELRSQLRKKAAEHGLVSGCGGCRGGGSGAKGSRRGGRGPGSY